jgi:aspartate carbamoyltransferase catalytic subunit
MEISFLQIDVASRFFSPLTSLCAPLLSDDATFPQEVDDVKKVLGETDVLYVTRIQKERFADLKEYDQVCTKRCNVSSVWCSKLTSRLL